MRKYFEATLELNIAKCSGQVIKHLPEGAVFIEFGEEDKLPGCVPVNDTDYTVLSVRFKTRDLTPQERLLHPYTLREELQQEDPLGVAALRQRIQNLELEKNQLIRACNSARKDAAAWESKASDYGNEVALLQDMLGTVPREKP